ncbi:MAG: PTS sugar transporter subunit IIA [Candidatus Omnitrophica bacterium]|nr:PTS sugar transporter subunit IIA [Candidatus Omnitrophota bacterium]
MKISDHLNVDLCVMDLQAVGKNETIEELASVLNAAGKVSDQKKFVADILEREALGSTGIGHGVAIPHSRTKSVDEFLIAFGKSTAGVEFQALDGEKVNLVFLMGANPKELNLYLRLLAELSKLLMHSPFRQELSMAKTAEEVIEIFKKFES